MCLVLIGWKVHPDFPLIVAANRDEIHTRGSASAQFWKDCPQIYAGRDIDGGGTWMGITRTGRFATVTNYRDPSLYRENKLSRGQLAKDFLVGCESAYTYALRIQECAAKYNPFNLLICDTNELVWLGFVPNILCQVVRIPAGIHGVSNHLLNTPWPKLVRAKERFQACLSALPDHAAFRKLLQDREENEKKMYIAYDLDPEISKLMSSVFIVSADYGTRSSTVVTCSTSGEIIFEEVTYDQLGTQTLFSSTKIAMA